MVGVNLLRRRRFGGGRSQGFGLHSSMPAEGQGSAGVRPEQPSASVTAGDRAWRRARSFSLTAGCCPGDKLRGFGGGAPKSILVFSRWFWSGCLSEQASPPDRVCALVSGFRLLPSQGRVRLDSIQGTTPPFLEAELCLGFHRVQFSPLLPWRESVPRRRTPRLS